MGLIDPVKRRLYIRKYIKKNRFHLRKLQAKWRNKTRKLLRIRQKKWVDENPEKMLVSRLKTRAHKRGLILTKKQEGCKDCGEKDVRVIHLHAENGHTKNAETIRRKNNAIGDGSRWSYACLKKEIAICIPLCANCHIKRHSDAQGVFNLFPKNKKEIAL